VIAIEGRGLHTGAPARVVLSAAPGPVVVCAGGVEARIDELEVAATRRATTVEAKGGALRVGTVEHLFAALAGLGVHAGLRVEIDGPEVPLVDGGAARWCEAVRSLVGAPAGRGPLRVAREGAVEVASSRYEFTPGETFAVSVRLETGDDRLEAEARWDGDPDDFESRIAPARTFAMEHEIEELLRRGLASHVDRESVVVVARAGILSAGRPFRADEPARHKLLDFLGDLYVAGGPPVGCVRALRPGHAANARALRQAVQVGILSNIKTVS
jgi:UDP-3-O-[3-hydroxymyristoyl] N-acetylglucosamine deacetylase